jgi:hypothetical protein
LRSVHSCMLAAATAIAAVAPAPASAQSIGWGRTARHTLGFSGAVVSITEHRRHWPIADRIFTLTGANGHVVKLRLQKGGGTAGNDAINLFVAKRGEGDQYYVLSERDCVEFDPIRVIAEYCSQRPPCDGHTVIGLTYLGRFDWMNGFDPPGGRFRYAFRYLPAEDAAEGGSCPTDPD